MNKTSTSTTVTIAPTPDQVVEVEVALVVNGDYLILSQADAKSLLNCIRSIPTPPANGKVLLTVVAETTPY
jgi:hypothetical protein